MISLLYDYTGNNARYECCHIVPLLALSNAKSEFGIVTFEIL